MALSKETKEKLSVTSIADVAACFGVDPSMVKEWIKAGMPRTCTTDPEVKSRRYVYYVSEIAPWLRKKGPWQHPRGGGGKGDNRGSRAGSPLAEETQRVKLAKERLELSIRRKHLVDVEQIREALLRWAQRRRREIEVANKQFGREFGAFLNEGLEAEKRAIDNDFPQPESGTDAIWMGAESGNGSARNADQRVGGE